MGNEEKKEYLLQYGRACKRIENLKEQLVSLREVERSAKGQQLSDMPKGSRRHRDLSDLMVRIERLGEKIEDELEDSLAIRTIIEESILGMENADEARVLRMRYIDLMQWKDIRHNMSYSKAQVHRIHANALENIKMRHNETF